MMAFVAGETALATHAGSRLNVWGSMSTRSFVALDRYEQVASFFRVIVASVLALLVAGTGCVFALLCWKTADDLEPGE